MLAKNARKMLWSSKAHPRGHLRYIQLSRFEQVFGLVHLASMKISNKGLTRHRANATGDRTQTQAEAICDFRTTTYRLRMSANINHHRIGIALHPLFGRNLCLGYFLAEFIRGNRPVSIIPSPGFDRSYCCVDTAFAIDDN